MNISPPALCTVLNRPIRWIPGVAHSAGLALLLNRVFQDFRSGSDMAFLRGKRVQVVIPDIDATYSLLFNSDGRFVPTDQAADAQVRISGNLQTFLLLATRREDAEALFFRRLLRMEGETATGLQLKNFLDALGDPPLPEMLRQGLDRFTGLYLQHCNSAQPVSSPGETGSARPLG